jgi:predicted metal-binding membrane protein
MTTPDVVAAQSRLARAAWRAGLLAELGPAVLVLAAWAALVVSGRQGAGMDMGAHPDSAWKAAAAGLPGWMLMTVAMMGPAALARFRCIGSAAVHAARATAGFALAYLAVWAVFGLGVQAAAARFADVPGTQALALALLAAVAWQLSPVKRRLLRGSHRDPGGPPAGALSGREAVGHGLRYGLCCLGACWCLMLVMVAAPAGQLLWLAGLTALVTAERVFPGTDAAARVAAAALGVALAATLAVGGLFLSSNCNPAAPSGDL